MPLFSGQPDRPEDPDDGPQQHRPAPGGDVPPIRRLLLALQLVAVLCAVLAVILWWQILR